MVNAQYQFLAFLAVLIWGANAILVKQGLSSLDEEWFNWLRFGFAVPFLFVFRRPSNSFYHLFVISVFWYVLNFNFLTKSIATTSSLTTCVFVMQLCVIFGIIYNRFINQEQITFNNYLGMSVCVVGLYILVNPDFANLDSSLLWALGAANSWGLGFALIKKFKLKNDLSDVVWLAAISFFIQSIINVCKLGLVMPDVNGDILPGVMAAFGAFLFASVIAVKIWLFITHKVPLPVLSAYSMLTPVIASLFSLYFYEEQITVRIIFGAMIIIIGLLVTNSRTSIISSFFSKMVDYKL